MNILICALPLPQHLKVRSNNFLSKEFFNFFLCLHNKPLLFDTGHPDFLVEPL